MKHWLSLFLFAIILVACGSPATVTNTPFPPTEVPTEAPTPTATATATATETPSPESLLPQEVKEKFELAGVDLAKMQNAKYDKDGLHITLPGGEVIVLTNDQLQKGMYNGQDNVLQYRDEASQNAVYAFDKESGKWEMERPIKEFPWCKDMRLFEQCVIDVADLQEHGRFAQSTLTEDLFDPSQLKIITAFNSISSPDGKLLVPNVETAPNYKNEATAPFKKDYMFGITEIGSDKYIVIQVPYYVKGIDPKEWPVITGLYFIPSDRKGAWPVVVDYYTNRMNVVPWNISDLSLATEYINPKTGVNFTFEEVQSIIKEMKVGNFANTNGLVLKFDIARVTGGWYE